MRISTRLLLSCLTVVLAVGLLPGTIALTASPASPRPHRRPLRVPDGRPRHRGPNQAFTGRATRPSGSAPSCRPTGRTRATGSTPARRRPTTRRTGRSSRSSRRTLSADALWPTLDQQLAIASARSRSERRTRPPCTGWSTTSTSRRRAARSASTSARRGQRPHLRRASPDRQGGIGCSARLGLHPGPRRVQTARGAVTVGRLRPTRASTSRSPAARLTSPWPEP